MFLLKKDTTTPMIKTKGKSAFDLELDLMKRTRYEEFGPLEINDYEEFLARGKEQFESTYMQKVLYQEKLTDFVKIESLGHGTFGDVILVDKKSSHTTKRYAMKILEKKRIVEKKQVENTRSEKDLMQSINHPLTIHLDYFFQDNTYLYLIMPHISGGELYHYLRKFKKFEEDQTKFYTAQVILALEFLHYINFVHRDLKPENILIDHFGYLKLADFGFCKRLDKGRTYTLCGTPEYMAPEIVSHKGYGFAVDWWAVGVLIYELNCGSSPFFSKNSTKVFKKIVSNLYKMPIFFSTELKDIVNNLLQDNISKRYGNLKNGVSDIKSHRWFRSVNWLAILNRKAVAPFKPLVRKHSTRQPLSDFNLDLPVESVDKFKHIFENF